MKTFFLIVALFSLILVWWFSRKTSDKLSLYGTESKDSNSFDMLTNRLPAKHQKNIERFIRKVGFDQLDVFVEFRKSNTRISIIIILGGVLMYLATKNSTLLFTALLAPLYVTVRGLRLMDENQVNITVNSQSLIRTLSRELSRRLDYERAFTMAHQEVGSGRLKYVLKEVMQYQRAVKGDTPGAIYMLRELAQHEIIDMLASALEGSLKTSKQEETLNALELRVQSKIQEAIKKSTNSKRILAYMNSAILMVALFLQAVYVIISKLNFDTF